MPRFAYEDHLAALTGPDRHWPESTRQISQLRLRLEFERREGFCAAGPAALTIDIVDYPGEWLLDLPLLDKTYRDLVARDLRGQRFRRPRAFRGGVARLRPDAGPRPRGRRRRAQGGGKIHRLFARRARAMLTPSPPCRQDVF